jgi:TolB-like protein/class 3 adenylate cyclase/Tfp pilus assembly protein PilF
MEETGVKRKLTVILAADAEGYTRLMREAEEPTLQTLTEYRDIIDGLIARHDGRIFGTAGDSVVAEFGSAVEAVRCAISIQEELAVRNAELSDDRKLRFRIGINVGDVMAKGDDLFGDGVNVAARLEGLAEPGGICVSASVFDQVKHKMSLGFEDIGPQQVKNVAEPVPAFRIVPGSVSVAPGGKPVAKPSAASPWRIPAIAAAVIVVVAVGGLAIWDAYLRPVLAPQVTAPEKAPAPAFPDKPSIAVLPFDNLSGDPEQEYFSDGITEDLITDLAKISGLFVVSRKAVFHYKGKGVKLAQVSRELGIRYVLEGSVRKAGAKIRINAQLIDATTGGHLWAERYDRDLKDIFALQDEITEKIVAALEVKLTKGEQEQVARRYTGNLEAYDLYLRGREYQLGRTKQGLSQTRQALERAIELDPKFAEAHAVLSFNHFLEWVFRWNEDQVLEVALELAQKAVALDDTSPLAHTQLGWMHLWRDRNYEQAIAEARRAVALDPNYAGGYARLGAILQYAGRPQEGIALVKKAMGLDPHFPFIYLFWLGEAYYFIGQYDEALASLERSVTRNPNHLATRWLLVPTYVALGRHEEARAEIAEMLRISPRISLQFLRPRLPYKNQAAWERAVDALRKAGLPEKPRATAR